MGRRASRAGNGLIYDTALKITWLRDANLAASNTFGVSGISPTGLMSWTTQPLCRNRAQLALMCGAFIALVLGRQREPKQLA
jgi:hypothetical protein